MLQRFRRVFGLRWLALCLFLGSWLTADRALDNWKQSAWPSTLGIFDDVRTETREEPPGWNMLARTSTWHWSSYTYTEDGKKYWREVPELLEPRTFIVYYDPAHPQRSTVKRPGSPIPPLILSVLFLTGGVAAVWAARKPRQETP